MFKELYTKANNRIDTKEPYARMMEKLEKAPPRISVVKRVEYAAALAACVCLTFVGVRVYDKEQLANHTVSEIQKIARENPDSSTENIKTDLPEATPSVITEDTAKPAQPKAEKKAKVHTPVSMHQVPEVTIAPAAADVQETVSASQEEAATLEEKSEDSAVQAPAATEAAVSENGIMLTAIYDEKTEENTQSDTAESSAASGGGSTSRRAAAETTELSFSEYCEYMGKTPNMPSGYERVSADFKEFEILEDQTLADERWTHTYEKGGKQAEVTMTRELSDAAHYLDSYETDEIAGVKAVLFSEADNHSAYFINGSIAFEVNVYNMDRTELDEIIEALTK